MLVGSVCRPGRSRDPAISSAMTLLARRAEQRGDRSVGIDEALADRLAQRLPAADMRRHQDHALARRQRGLESATPSQRRMYGNRLCPRGRAPQQRQLGRHGAGRGDRGTVLGGRDARALGVLPEPTAVVRRQPPDQPAQQAADRMQQRQRHVGEHSEQSIHRNQGDMTRRARRVARLE